MKWLPPSVERPVRRAGLLMLMPVGMLFIAFGLDVFDIFPVGGEFSIPVIVGIGVIILLKQVIFTHRVIRRLRQHHDLVCPQCEYALVGVSAENRCPECGWRYDDKSELRKRWRHWREFTRHQLIGLYVLLIAFAALSLYILYANITAWIVNW